jgi:hypothetical protein
MSTSPAFLQDRIFSVCANEARSGCDFLFACPEGTFQKMLRISGGEHLPRARHFTELVWESDRLSDTASEIEVLQQSIDKWVADAKGFVAASVVAGVGDKRKNAFIEAFRKYLVALGHSEVNQQNAQMVTLDQQYIPFMNNKRLRTLGSASDQSRLVAAYSLALAAASEQMDGQHPGFVILDEPLQQNPDEKHREFFSNFLTKELPQKSTFQTLILTWLSDPEIDKLRKQGTNVIMPPGAHFFQPPKAAATGPWAWA